MPELPPVANFRKYPATSALAGAAILATLAWQCQIDMKPFTVTYEWPYQPWRLLTSALLHVNFIHLIFNLYWLWAFGTLLERRFGTLKIVLIYVLLAAVPSAGEFAFMHGGVGLSGVVYGLFGMLYAMDHYVSRYSKVLDERTIKLFVVWFFICIATTVLNIMLVGNIAHGVGALAGFLLGHAASGERDRRMLSTGALTIVSLLCLCLASVGREYVNLTGAVSYQYWERGIDALAKNDNEKQAAERATSLEKNSKYAALWDSLK